MVPAYLNVRATGGAVASPYVGGLGGMGVVHSLVPFLLHERNEHYLLVLSTKQASLNLGEDLNAGFLRFDYSNGAI